MIRVLAFVFLALTLNATVFAQEQPIVRVTVTPSSVIVGEPAELTVTVLVPTWFTRPPVYPTFELANAMTRLPPDSSYPIRERVGNESWSGIVRSYEIYPLLGATYRMAGQQLAVTFADPGKDPVNVEVDLPEAVFKGTVPAGAETLDPYVAGRSLKLNLEIDGELDDLEAGDAIVLTYRAELDGLPAIFLPPLAPALEFEGVSTYRDMPEVQDADVAHRVERITLVFDAGGEFSVPDLELAYWNTNSKSVEVVKTDGIFISVKGEPVTAPQNVETSDNRWRPAIVGAGFLLVLLLMRGAGSLVRRYWAAAERRRQTEHYAFRQLSRTLRSADNEKAYRALLQWLERLQPGMSARAFAEKYGDESLSEAIASLSAGIFGRAEKSGDFRRIQAALAKARKRYLARGSARRVLSLPPLNP
jgi:hypothetical protein